MELPVVLSTNAHVSDMIKINNSMLQMWDASSDLDGHLEFVLDTDNDTSLRERIQMTR